MQQTEEFGKAHIRTAEKVFEEGRRDKNGKPIRSFVSTGEKIHNEITYRGVDWLLNSAFGVAFGYWTHRTETGRKYFAEPVEKFFNKALKPIIQNDKSREEGAKWGGTFLSIMAGGTVTIPPLMYLENPKNKVPIVKNLDTMIYGKDKVEHDPKFQQAYEEIRQQPKKDFGTGMKTRFMALAPLLAITIYEPTNKLMQKHFYDHISTGTKWVAEKMGLQKGGYWAKKSVAHAETMAADELAKVPTNKNYLHDVIAFDFGLTILYSFLHEAAYKLFARKKDDKKQGRKERNNEAIPVTISHNANDAVELQAAEKPATPAAPQLAETPTPQVSQIAEREMLAQQQQAQLA